MKFETKYSIGDVVYTIKGDKVQIIGVRYNGTEYNEDLEYKIIVDMNRFNREFYREDELFSTLEASKEERRAIWIRRLKEDEVFNGYRVTYDKEGGEK